MIKTIARAITPRWMWSRLRAWNMRRILDRFQPYVTEHSYAGVRLKVHIADPLAQGWYDQDWVMMPEVELLRQGRLRAGSRVFDMGAHQGVVAMILAHAVGPSGAVLAVEVLPHNARIGAINAQLNGLSNIHYEHAAISDRSGTVDVSLDLNAHVRHSATNITTIPVQAVTVDELSDRFGRPDVLFIDVEGFECHTLRGACANPGALSGLFHRSSHGLRPRNGRRRRADGVRFLRWPRLWLHGMDGAGPMPKAGGTCGRLPERPFLPCGAASARTRPIIAFRRRCCGQQRTARCY